MLVFVLCGLLAGLGGIILAGNLASANPDLGQGYELDVIAAVILGGTALAGGRGSIPGVVLGALLMARILQRIRASRLVGLLAGRLQRLGYHYRGGHGWRPSWS